MKKYNVAISTFIRGDFRNEGEQVTMSEEDAAGYIKEGLLTEEASDEPGDDTEPKKPAAKKSK